MTMLEDFSNIFNVDKATTKKIMMFLYLAMVTPSGRATKFSRKYGIMKYKDLYDYLKTIKMHMKSDNETLAMNMYVEMYKSITAGASIMFKRQFNLDPQTSMFYGGIFTNRTFGIVIDNLVNIKKVIDNIDSNKTQFESETKGYANSEDISTSLSDEESKVLNK